MLQVFSSHCIILNAMCLIIIGTRLFLAFSTASNSENKRWESRKLDLERVRKEKQHKQKKKRKVSHLTPPQNFCQIFLTTVPGERWMSEVALVSFNDTLFLFKATNGTILWQLSAAHQRKMMKGRAAHRRWRERESAKCASFLEQWSNSVHWSSTTTQLVSYWVKNDVELVLKKK